LYFLPSRHAQRIRAYNFGMTILFGIPHCDTVKKSRAWFTEQGLATTFHDFKKQGVPPGDLAYWVQVLGWEAVLNKKGTTWRKLDAASQAAVVDAASAQALMLREPSVIKRPIVVQGANVVVGYQPAAWLALNLS
jgi:arsenate reductase (glutaredoxin)